MADKNVELGEMLYDGKVKQVFAAPGKDLVVVHFKDDIVLNGEIKGQIEGKGIVNNKLSASIFRFLEFSGVPTHFVTRINDREQLCRKVFIIPMIVTVRNSEPDPKIELARKSNCKDDAEKDNEIISEKALQINSVIRPFLLGKKIKLIDLKLEFGRTEDDQIVLTEEISPDTCSFLDLESNEEITADRLLKNIDSGTEMLNKLWERIGEFHVTGV